MAQIIVAVDESYDATSCGGDGTCSGDEFQCLTHDLWMELSQEIHGFLNGITLAEMKMRNDVVEVVNRQEGRVTGPDGKTIGSIAIES